MNGQMLTQFLELNNNWQQQKYIPLAQAFSYDMKWTDLLLDKNHLTGFVMSLMDLQLHSTRKVFFKHKNTLFKADHVQGSQQSIILPVNESIH
jgi:hypothetical protein